jgi:hypothetical protein
MAKPWLCRLGWHKWTLQHTEDGNRYRECAGCAKVDDRMRPPPSTGLVGGG